MGTDDRTEQAWSGPVSRRAFLRWRTPAFAVALGLLVVAALAGVDETLGWPLAPLDWLFAASLLVLLAYVLAPLAVNRSLATRYWTAIRGNRLAVASLGYLALLFLVGVLGPVVIGHPSTDVSNSFQPPAFTAVTEYLSADCVGPVVDGQCHGTLEYPFGTNNQGQDMVQVVALGARVAVQVALVASTIMVPVGLAVGMLAGYRGGLVDDVVMRLVDVQGALPAFLVYMVLIFVYGRDLLLLVLVFGLLSWGGVARIARSEVRQLRDASYVQAARVAGADSPYVLRRVLLPNVSSTVVTAVTRQASTLILVEAALAFMELSEDGVGSWGEVISYGTGDWFPRAWWVSTWAVVALALTVVALNVFGDALRDVLDPDAE
jgi:peptide/nickel transport system permease protein